MKQNQPPKSDDVKGNVDQTKIARGALPRFSGQGYHADKREKRGSDQKRKELRNDDYMSNEVAPAGWEGTVRAMKKHKDIDNPWALAWSMKKKGYESHIEEPKKKKRKKKKHEEALGFPTFSEWLKNNHSKIYDENAKSILLAGLAGAGIGGVLGAAAPHTKDYDPKNALHHAVGAKHTAMDAFSDMPIEKRVGLGGALGAAAGAGDLANALRKRKGWMKK